MVMKAMSMPPSVFWPKADPAILHDEDELAVRWALADGCERVKRLTRRTVFIADAIGL